MLRHFLYLLLIFSLCAISVVDASEKQHIDKSAVQQQSCATEHNRAISSVEVKSNDSISNQQKDSSNATDCKEQTGEGWWKKLRDDPVATFTMALFIATAALIGTGGIQWYESRSTAQRQLRAYVALDKIFFHSYQVTNPGRLAEVLGSITNVTTDNLIVSIKNYGNTPAFDTSLRCTSNKGQGKPIYLTDIHNHPGVGRQMLHPTMRFDTEVTENSSPRHDEPGWVWGYIVYRDIYNRWWRTNFFFAHHGKGDLTPESEYNNEKGPFKTENEAFEYNEI